ncbi:hypothetical protein XENOCAPTIV_011736 [Xenoophorus captivus]|uniref:Uncharacterized protein n=1 Tax=Xenoophorus captivus TaxID=1517983 RepID=A0ABV0S6S4_9TELE
MSKSPVEPLSAVESGSQSHYFQVNPLTAALSSPSRKLPKRKSRFKRSDGSTSSDTTSSFIKRQVKVFFLSKQIDAHLCQ